MRLTSKVHSKASELPKDSKIINSFEEVVGFLDMNGINNLVIGSCATLSHFDYAYRLPGDIDFVINKKDLRNLENIANGKYDLINMNGFYQFYVGKLKIHIVVDDFKFIDPENRQIIGSINLLLPPSLTTERAIEFRPVCGCKAINICVPIIEICFVLNLLAPVNTHSIEDAIMIVNNFKLQIHIMVDFLDSHSGWSDLFCERIDNMIRFISQTEELRNLKTVDFLVELFDRVYL